MKGAKGGKRDRLISLLFSKKKSKEKEEKITLDKDIKKEQKNKNKKAIDLETLDEVTKKEKKVSTVNIEVKTVEKKKEKIEVSKEKENIKIKDIIKSVSVSKTKRDYDTKLKRIKSKEKSKETIINNIEKDIPKKQVAIKEDDVKQNTSKKQDTINKNNDIKVANKANTGKNNSIDNNIINKNKVKKLEYLLYKKIKKVVNKDYNELCDLEYKYKIISQKEKSNYDEKEIKEIKKRLEEIIKKLDKLREKYKNFENVSELNRIVDIDNTYIEVLLNNYKKEIETSEELEKFSKHIKTNKYDSVLKSIYDLEKDKDILQNKLEEKIDILDINKKEYKKMEEEYLNTLNYKKDIDKFNESINKELNDINNKLASSKVVTKSMESLYKYKTNYNNFFESMIMFNLSKKIPNTACGTALKTVMITNAIMKMKNFVTKEKYEKEKIEITYKDFSDDLSSSINNVDNVISKTDKAVSIIKQIKKSLELSVLSPPLANEYKELLDKVNKIDETLQNNRDCLSNYKNDMEKKLYNNNARVLTYGVAKN